MHGITLSTHRSGQEWASDAVVPALADIRSVGAGWVAIHPYARIHADGRVTFRNAPLEVQRPIREAHHAGLKILIKPHLAYWGSPFSWRGEITFDDAAHWKTFWRDYRRWIDRVASWSTDADGFVVGTELDRTLEHRSQWREVIASVRERVDAPLTYAANWTDYRRVPFWDALDVIGIQAYFPLVDQSLDPARLRESDFEAGWRRLMTELRAFALRRGRNIVFTELGYNRSMRAPLEPWSSRSDGADEATATQEACMDAALRALAQEPAVVGAFLWKWFPPPRSAGRNFQLTTPGMRAVIGRHWRR